MSKQSFEEALKELETIVASLEEGELPLEEAVKKYEAGRKLAEHCQTLLEDAEKVLTKVMTKTGEEVTFDSEE